MEPQAQPVWQPAATYQPTWTFQAEGKVDNRAYATATLALWAEASRCEPVPGFDAHAAPEQPIPVSTAADYLNLFA